jgi:outer membrane receptor protein involved in Fe transport
VVRYQTRLFSDFTFQLVDPIHFDEIEQDDQRLVTGLSARYRRTTSWGSINAKTTLGAQARYDDIHTGLFHDQARVRLSTTDDALIGESNVAAYAEEDVRFSRWLRVVGGVRADLFDFNVADQVGNPSGIAQKSMVNPKLQVVIRPATFWDIYLDGGGGFHSNDARAVVQGTAGALARAWGGEVGSRVRLFEKLDLAVALWGMHLSSEQVFNADLDTTVASDPTERFGVDLEARYEILPWLWADGDLDFARATFTTGGLVPLAPTRTASAGISALHPAGYKARIGMRHVGDRPATRDGSLIAQGYTLFEATVGYRHKWWELGLVIENLFNTSWAEAQFASQSQLVEAPYNETQPVTDLQFTPGNPINVRVTASAYF